MAVVKLIGPDGGSLTLAEPTYRLTMLEGVEMPDISLDSHASPGWAGEFHDQTVIGSRPVTLTIYAMSDTIPGINTAVGNLIAALRPSRSRSGEAGYIEYAEGAVTVRLAVRLLGVLAPKTGGTSRQVTLRLMALSPYWQAYPDTTEALTHLYKFIPIGMMGWVDNAWDTLGITTLSARIYDALVTDDKIYVVGLFTNFNGIANADYIAVYDKATGAWSDMGGLAGANFEINRIVQGPDGKIGRASCRERV